LVHNYELNPKWPKFTPDGNTYTTTQYFTFGFTCPELDYSSNFYTDGIKNVSINCGLFGFFYPNSFDDDKNLMIAPSTDAGSGTFNMN